MNKRFMIFVALMVLAMVMAGGAFAQIVVGIGAEYNSDTSKGSSGGPTETDTTSNFSIPLSAGYRMGAMGFGLDFNYGGSKWEQDPSNPFTPYPNSSDLKIGGYFEYGLLQGEKLSFWGKAGVGYLGTFDKQETAFGGMTLLGNRSGFYLSISPVLEYKLFKYVSVFASCELIEFSYTSWKAEQYWDTMGASGTWKSLSSGFSLEKSEAKLTWPLQQGIQSISIGAKVVF